MKWLLPELEPIRLRHLAPERREILELAQRLCVAKCAAVLRDLRVFEAPADARAASVATSVIELGLEAGLLRRTATRVVPTAKLAQAAPYGELLVEHANTVQRDVVAFRWLTRALDALPSVLVGAVLAEEALFPRNDFSLVSDLYAKSSVFSFFSKVTVDLLAKQGPLRVLEVGGGTGSTARAVLEQNEQLSYHFTDVAPLFVERARTSLGERCTSQVLDLDAETWTPEPGFDAVVALNVLHLAKDEERVLSRLRSLMSPGGMLILGEVSPPGEGPFPLMELTFGLLPSFRAKGGSPLESPARWQALLTSAGFTDLRSLPLTLEQQGENLGGVTLAFAPGAPS